MLIPPAARPGVVGETGGELAGLRRRADAGNGAAAFTLWLRLRDDDREAAEGYLRLGAELGDVAAAYNLGLLLWRERGEPEAARAMLDKGAQGGDPGAMRDLGLLLREQGDLERAIYWLGRAVERGARRPQSASRARPTSSVSSLPGWIPWRSIDAREPLGVAWKSQGPRSRIWMARSSGSITSRSETGSGGRVPASGRCTN